MKTLYQIVGTNNDGDMMTREELLSRCELADEQRENPHLREELRGQPILKNMCGPMWGGFRDDTGEYVFFEGDRDNPASPVASYSPSKGPATVAVVRYETWEAYEILSR